jgi:cytochrome c551/c552
MKKIILIAAVVLFTYACSDNKPAADEASATKTSEELFDEGTVDQPADAKPANDKGIGKFTNVELDEKLDVKMAAVGNGVYELKCLACHKLTDEKIVGPGWAGVTTRRTPEWIMNFLTNVDEMIDKDPQAQAMLEICMVRMPNQNISDEESRALLEFMRKNDGVK